MKRLALTVLFFLVVGTPAHAAGISGAFTDDDGSPHEPDINGIAAAAITLGCGGTNYCPHGSVTRAEMATFLVRSLKLAPVPSGPFTDTAGNIHAESINALAAAGITTGCSPTAFCPSGLISREEMATFLARALKLAPVTANFTDVGPGTHAESIGAIAAAGITAGCGVGLYCPTNPVTREQMATFLARGFKIEKVYPQIPLLAGTYPWCTKDGLICSASITIPYRSQYEVREGFYDVANSSSLTSGATRVEVFINGFPVALEALPVPPGAALPQRLFSGTTTLAPGTQQISVRWYWNGVLEQTTNVSVTVLT